MQSSNTNLLKRSYFFAILCILILISCKPNTHDTKPLSAGETVKPNTNYNVENPSEKDYEEPHNTRVDNPYFKVNPNLSPDVPNQLRPHSRLVLTDIEDRTFFDYFGWQTFIGLIWPADSLYRGVPNRKISAEDFSKYNTTDPNNANRVPVVWETFRTFDEAFPQSYDIKPEAWDASKYERPFNLDLTAKMRNLAPLNEAFSSPLVDQNRQYVRYSLQLNEVMYEFIRQNEWYLKGNLPKSPTQASLPPLPVDDNGNIVSVQQPQTNTIIKQPVNGNSIELKSAWRIMITEDDPSKPWRQKDDLSRYYVSKANVQNVMTGKVEEKLVGLVGLHVVVKTPQFTQGIWSSFEHVDNITTPKGSGIRPSFNKGDGKYHEKGFSYQPSDSIIEEKDRKPVEVSRVYKIPDTPVAIPENLPDGTSTVGLNKAYKKLLKGTVWEYYQLVITQWPTDPTTFYAKPFLKPRGPRPNPKTDLPAIVESYERAKKNEKYAYPKWSGLPIPQVGALNTTMETYFQNPKPLSSMESTSCMGCHYNASDMDYSWAFKLRTFPNENGFDQGRLNPKIDSLMLIDYTKKKKGNSDN